MKKVKSVMLDQAYQEIFEDNTEEGSASRALAIKALKWMTCAKQSLTIAQLAQAVSISDDEAQAQAFEEISEEDVLLICSNFIIADEFRVAQFAHLSVPEYLGRRKCNDVKEFSLEQAHIQATMSCLICLSRSRSRPEAFKTECATPGWRHVGQQLDRWDNMLRYSMAHWPDHMAAISPQNRSIPMQRLVDHIIMDWLDMIPIFEANYPMRYEQARRFREAISSPLNRVFAACAWGLTNMLPKNLLNSDFKVKNSQGAPGLVIAATHGHHHLVALLLHQGANVGMPWKYYEDALYHASDEGHEDIVRLLLKRGGNLNLRERCFGNALVTASQRNHENVVRLLLERGVDVNAQDMYRHTSLSDACYFNHENVVRLLLDHGADINIQVEDYGGALQAASEENHENIVRLLLCKRANVIAQHVYDEALEKAAQNDHETIVQLLRRAASLNLG